MHSGFIRPRIAVDVFGTHFHLFTGQLWILIKYMAFGQHLRVYLVFTVLAEEL